MSVYAGPEIVNDGLVLHLDAANAKSYPRSGNTWNSLITSSNAAQFQVASNFSANNSGVFSFDGATQYATIASAGPSVAVAGTVTQESVVNFSNTSSLQCVFCRGRTGVSFNYGITINSNTLRFRNSSQDHIVSGPLTTNTWYHLVIVTTPSGSVGYVNGVRQPNTTVQTTSTNSLQEITIGRRSTNSALEYLNGSVALIRVYHDKAFTDAEVLQNFNAIRGRFNV